MIGLLFDFIIAGLLTLFLVVNVQFLTGLGVGRGFNFLRYHFRVDGDRGKKISYTVWKDDP